MALNEFLKKTGKKRFLANINPTNYKSIQFFGKNGFSHIISTYQKKIDDEWLLKNGKDYSLVIYKYNFGKIRMIGKKLLWIKK